MINPRNVERAAKMRERNFQPRPVVPPRCVIQLLLAEYQRKHGSKQVPQGWSSCWGPVDQAHVLHARGMGGCNSSKDEAIELCRGHHGEQEGRSTEFEARYKINLRELVASRPVEGTPPA
jgi:hypothetical protein